MVESTEILGSSRSDAYRKMLTESFKSDIIDLLCRELEKLAQIHLMNIRDLFIYE
jgi:hypothetical protein